MTAILRAKLLAGFTCLGDKCEDTCCQNWSMQMDEPTLASYGPDAPELLEAVEREPDGSAVMRKDPASGFCVKLEGGFCGIHKKNGPAFLGDACYFYPRVTRRLGERVIMTATLSCPEIARLALAGEGQGACEPAEAERLPHDMKNYLPEGMDSAAALEVHEAFLHAARDEQAPVERIFLRIASASRSLERIDRKNWPAMAAFYLAHADTRLPPAEGHSADPFNLLHSLSGLIVASRRPASARLMQTIQDMERALGARLDWEQVLIHPGANSLREYARLQALWRNEGAAAFAPALRRWLGMQLSLALWPYAGLGESLSARVTIIGVRLATLRLALLSAYGLYGPLSGEMLIRIMQSLSRFMDHLGDADFSLKIYGETGWTREERMRGLLEN